MNALPSTKWLVLGLGAYALATLACSAEASSPPPSSGNQAGSGGSGVGTAGTTGVGTAGTTAVGTAGTTAVGTAGTTAVGTAGTTGAGGMSGGALTACPAPPAAGAIADLLIDNLEPDAGDASGNALPHVGNRTGFWYTYVDALGSMIIPAPDPSGASPLKPGMTNCHGASMGCVLISGTTAMADELAMKYPYAGVGFDFSNAKKPCVYNASAYAGIKFWARGDVPITIKLNTAATATPDGGGTCAGTMCNGGFSPAGVDVVLTPDWQEIDINFAMAAPPTWAAELAPHPDKASLLSVPVQIPPGHAFSVALDDFTFY